MLAIALLLLCRDIGAPFNGWHAVNDALHAQAARNHLRYGLLATGLYETYTASPSQPPQRYLNHPPLVAVFTAVPLAVFGEHEWAARSMPIVATLGSTWLLMTIAGGLAGPLSGVLAGFFFATLPLTAYFGRMIDHEAPVQLFSLLMVHGYLHWTGSYGGSSRRRTGAASYALAAILGIGTGWAALLPAGLVWLWHLWRVWRRAGEARLLLWLAAVPALATTAVVLHIAAGGGWDVAAFRSLAAARSVGGEGGQQPWSAWLAAQGTYFARNFTWPGALATLVAVPLLLVRTAVSRGRGRGPVFGGTLAGVFAVCGAQGLLWVVVLKNQSWFHDYWQFYLAPCVALSMAGLLVAVHDRLAARAPRLAALAAALLLAAPMPFAAAALDFYARHRLVDPDYVAALVRLQGLVPAPVPAWTSHRLRESTAGEGASASHWAHPVIAYYADRPLFFSRDADEVRANAPGCSAYLLKRGAQPWAREIEGELSRSFASVDAGDEHVIFLLDRPLAPPVERR